MSVKSPYKLAKKMRLILSYFIHYPFFDVKVDPSKKVRKYTKEIIHPSFLARAQVNSYIIRGKSLLESWGTTFLPNLRPPLIFVLFISKSHQHQPYYQSTCARSLRSIGQILRDKGSCQSGRKVVTHNSKSDLPLASTYV